MAPDNDSSRGAILKSVENYAALDFSEESGAYKALKQAIEREVTSGVIVLSGAKQSYDAAQPAALTPTMAAWFSRFVAGPRSAAIGDLEQAFQRDSQASNGGHGCFLEYRRDTARKKFVVRSVEDSARFIDQNGATIRDNHHREQSYTLLKNRLNREPVRRPAWLYILILMLIVMLEAFINFESFLKVPYITSPFLATGATMAVGLGVGFSAHFHGIVLRQWSFLSSPQEAADQSHEERKRDAVRRLLLGAVLLGVALTMVGGSRYYYLRDYIALAQTLGTEPPSMIGGISFMLLGNLVAYFVGCLVSYMMHDPHPIYAEQDRELRRSAKKVDRIKMLRLQQQKVLRDGLETELKEISNQEQRTRGPNYTSLRELAGQVIAKDQEVIGALLRARADLLQLMRDPPQGLPPAPERIAFSFPDGNHEMALPGQIDLPLTIDGYAALPLSLGFDTGVR